MGTRTALVYGPGYGDYRYDMVVQCATIGPGPVDDVRAAGYEAAPPRDLGDASGR